MPIPSNPVPALTTLLAFLGCAYYLVALWSGRAFFRSSRKQLPDFHPNVSLLKPVKGLDSEMYAGFVSHCRQEYAGDYEILFAAGGVDDPAVEAIERLQREFPETPIRLILCPEQLGANGKVSSLAQALPHARYDYILINDSDIHVAPHYLRKILALFGRPGSSGKSVGMVTALYRGRAHRTIASRLEALGIASDFAPSVLTAQLLEGGLHFGLGSTLAVSRTALQAAGGLLPLVDHLADDYQLGARIAAAGYEVALSGEVVETSVPPYSFRAYWDHQIRWARTIRGARRGGYFGLIFSYGLAWALINVVASGGSLDSLALLSIIVAARAAVALMVGAGVLGDPEVLRNLWLLPARDLIALAVWAWGFAANTVRWRGETFTIREGRLYPIQAAKVPYVPRAG